MVNLAILSYLLYCISYGNDFFLLTYLILFYSFILTRSSIIFPSITSVIAFMYIVFVLILGILGGRFDYIEIDLLLSLGVISFMLFTNKNFVNWKFLHRFLLCVSIIFFLYWMLVLITPYNGTIYQWLRGYESLSYFFGLPRLNNVSVYYLLFLVCSVRFRLISLILVVPMLSVVPYSIIVLRMMIENLGKTFVLLSLITLVLSRLDVVYLSDFFTAFLEQKSISIKNRMILDFPGFFGALDNVRLSESTFVYIAQKYSYLVSLLLLVSIITLLKNLKISLLNSSLIVLLININPIFFGALTLFAKIAQERNFHVNSSNSL